MRFKYLLSLVCDDHISLNVYGGTNLNRNLLLHLCTLKLGHIFTLLVINKEGNLFIHILALLHRNHLTHGLLVTLQLQVTNNVRNLFALLIRQLSLDLNWDLTTRLSHNCATTRGSRQLLKYFSKLFHTFGLQDEPDEIRVLDSVP